MNDQDIKNRIEELQRELGLWEDQNLSQAAEHCRQELNELKTRLGYVPNPNAGVPPAYPQGQTGTRITTFAKWKALVRLRRKPTPYA
jgi:hypothetical protein